MKVTEFNELDQKLNDSFDRLDRKLDNLLLMLIKNQEEFREFAKTVATKDDVKRVLDRMDNFLKSLPSL